MTDVLVYHVERKNLEDQLIEVQAVLVSLGLDQLQVLQQFRREVGVGRTGHTGLSAIVRVWNGNCLNQAEVGIRPGGCAWIFDDYSAVLNTCNVVNRVFIGLQLCRVKAPPHQHIRTCRETG